MDINPQKPILAHDEFSIVLNGDFNPAIFQPFWLAKNDLIRENEATDAEIEILSQDIASFKLEWISFQVMPNRFAAVIKAEAYLKHLVDIVQSIFTILSNTPIRQLGINTTVSATFKKTEDWHAFGHFLIPKNDWANVLTKPGMRSMTVQGLREDKRPGFVVITTEPDLSIVGANKVYFRFNDHYDNPDLFKGVPMDAKWAVDILHESFENSMLKGFEVVDTLVDKFSKVTSVADGSNKDLNVQDAYQRYISSTSEGDSLFNVTSVPQQLEEKIPLIELPENSKKNK